MKKTLIVLMLTLLTGCSSARFNVVTDVRQDSGGALEVTRCQADFSWNLLYNSYSVDHCATTTLRDQK